MFALPSRKAWKTSTGKTPRRAAMRKNLEGSRGKLYCSAVNSIQGSSGPPRIRPLQFALKWWTHGWPTEPVRRR